MRERVAVVTLSVCLSVCHFFILEKVPFSWLKLTSVQSRFKSFKFSTFSKIVTILLKLSFASGSCKLAVIVFLSSKL